MLKKLKENLLHKNFAPKINFTMARDFSVPISFEHSIACKTILLRLSSAQWVAMLLRKHTHTHTPSCYLPLNQKMFSHNQKRSAQMKCQNIQTKHSATTTDLIPSFRPKAKQTQRTQRVEEKREKIK